ncbi:MAG TPA: tetratricopeptide repeat protein, partial [Hyphomonas sp.]|nr:tetratricopeptide repeat protein [Hyphomonas sp.]
EKNSESYPGQINTGKTLTVYRLKNAPFALQRLNAMVQAEWRGSPWVIVYAGASREEVFVSAVAQLESRDFPWVNVSDAPPAAGEAPTQPDAETLLADADAAEAAGDLFGSIRFANRACQLYHDYAACRRVALAYHNGKGVAKDLVRAREKMIALCHEADYESCFQVGEMLNDAGYENLRIIAAESYLAACNNKHSAACNNLGMFMEREETINMAGEDMAGGTKYAAALRLYVRACDLGNATACRNAGITYNWGEDGVASDHDLAVVYHRKACDLGKTESCGFE